MREAGSGTRAVLEAALRERGLDPAALGIALELPSNEAVRSAVAAGAGISGLSSLVVEAMIDAGRLVALPIDLAPRPFLALRHKERYRSRARSEEHPSELQALMRHSYAVFCLKTKK